MSYHTNKQTAYGCCYQDSNSSATTITDADTFYQLAGSFSSGELNDFEHDGSGKLTYKGGTTKKFKVDARDVSAVASDNGNWGLLAHKNGSSGIGVKLEGRQTSTYAYTDMNGQFGVVELATDDYVIPKVASNAGSRSITFSRILIWIEEI